MAFSARHLRVRLPCGEDTQIVEPGQLIAGAEVGVACVGWSCGCTGLCSAHTGGQPMVASGWCCASCAGCTFMSTNMVSAEDLPALRADLEARLRDLEAAERAVQQRLQAD